MGLYDYSLSAREVLQFPFVSPYGLRHLDRGDILNKTIGTIELFPILGPIVSLIEGLVAFIWDEIEANQRLKKPGFFNKAIGVIEIIPLIGSLAKKIDDLFKRKLAVRTVDLPIKDLEKWKKEFKANVLNKPALPPADLSLTEEQMQLIGEVIEDLENSRSTKKAKLYAANLDWVFAIENIPGKIFKVPMNRHSADYARTIEKRVKDTLIAKNVIRQEGLDQLHVPEQKIIKVKVKEENVSVLIEESMDILHGTLHQQGLFQYCYSDPELKPFIRECTRQLILFIIKTGFADVRYDNNPLLTNGRGIGLIDLDTTQSPICGLRHGCSSGQDGILQYLSSDEIEYFEPLLKKELTDEQFNALKLDPLKERLRKIEKEKANFEAYLLRRHVITSREPIDLTGWNPFASHSLIILEENINDMAAVNMGLHLPSDRCFYVRDHYYPEFLNGLKNNGSIFAWQNFKEINPNGAGFLIWV